MAKPTGTDLVNEDNFFEFVKSGQKYNIAGGIRSTGSINGSQQWAATTHTVADILQGNLGKTNPQDQLLVLNKGLTDSLKLLYESPEAVHGFSTFTSTLPGVSNGGAAGSGEYGSLGADGIGGTVEESWVLQLPVKHPQGGLIWMREGKGSLEMHLPVADNLADDVSMHKQYADLKPSHRHPWNMDREGGAVGGEARIFWDVAQAATKLGEVATTRGQISGAFPLLKPEEEQFYISMAWPYSGDPPKGFRKAGREDVAAIAETLKKDVHYRGKRILVYSKQTKRAVVCTPGDWGPHPYYSNGSTTRSSINGFCAGLSPDVHFALGTDHGADILLGWMPDDTPLGPYGTVKPSGFANGTINAASGTTSPYSVEQLKYAGNIVASHPNLSGEAFKNHLRNGFAPQASNHNIKIFFREINRGFHFPSLLNYLWYILEAGFKIRVDGIGYVHRAVVGGTRLSNHSTGGAVDIMAIGRGTAIGYTNDKWRAENDAMWNKLATLPQNTKPDEAASSFAYKYGWYNVYRDPNPTHVHLGFGPDQIGTLIPPLLQAQPQGARSVGTSSKNTTIRTNASNSNRFSSFALTSEDEPTPSVSASSQLSTSKPTVTKSTSTSSAKPGPVGPAGLTGPVGPAGPAGLSVDGVTNVVVVTQAEYDALTPDPHTLYIIT